MQKDLPGLSNRDFAELVGCDHQTVANLREKGMPSPKSGLAAAVRWYCEWIDGGRTLDIDARKRWEVARADKLEIENQRKRGELIPFTDARLVISEASAIFAGQMSALPSRLANELAGIADPGVIRDRIRFETTRIRKAVTDRCALLGAVPGGGGSGQAAADPESGRVGKRKPRAAAGKRRAGAVSD